MFRFRSVNKSIRRHPLLKSGVALIIVIVLMMTISGCSKKRETESDDALRQVLRVQRLQNLYPDADNVPEMETIVDSMGREGKSPYYFAALNVMTDRL
ncbi:MAG: hypothetical protein K2G69_06835, partial [Muribaculaceae bacterium]|nr:hypothetical protein [Muribaculaceae bacterium]